MLIEKEARMMAAREAFISKRMISRRFPRLCKYIDSSLIRERIRRSRCTQAKDRRISHLTFSVYPTFLY